MRHHLLLLTILVLAATASLAAGDAKSAAAPNGTLPPDWLPIAILASGTPEWRPLWKNPPAGPMLYLPAHAKRLRGVFVCYIFNDQDARELADLWDFALVAVPVNCEYDLGYFDKRNPRGKQGFPLGNMGNLLTYLDLAAKQFDHPELATAPIVGWVGQNGAVLAADLFKRAPDRLLAWTDAWDWSKVPEVAAHVPVASGWEMNKGPRNALIEQIPGLAGKPTPPRFLDCSVTTYGFAHGIWSKYIFFTFWLDRAIQARMPATLPAPGQPVPLRTLSLESGWTGDFAPVGSWNPIAPWKDASGFAKPVWFPDEYTAWGWRAFHSNCSDLEITRPSLPYERKYRYRPEMHNGYGAHLDLGATVTCAAAVTGDYAKVEFYDGNRKLGEATAAPWEVPGVVMDQRGVRALHVVGTRRDGSKAVSRPAFPIVR